MRFALDTIKEVVNGTRDRKIHAVFTFALWFAAAGFIISSFGVYIEPLSHGSTSILGAFLVATILSALKFS